VKHAVVQIEGMQIVEYTGESVDIETSAAGVLAVYCDDRCAFYAPGQWLTASRSDLSEIS